MFRESGNPAVEELTKSWKRRSINLWYLKPIKRDGKRYCCWCGIGELRHGSQRYCTPSCSTSATAWAYPQKEDALHFLLERQGWKCNLCQFDYSEFAKALNITVDSIWWKLKHLKDRLPDDRRLIVDHIIPIFKGGQSLGLSNHQAICYTCNKTKTSKDLSGPRKKPDGMVPV